MSKELIQEIVECLEWYVENDDTNNIPDNEYWLSNLERARKALESYHDSSIEEKLG